MCDAPEPVDRRMMPSLRPSSPSRPLLGAGLVAVALASASCMSRCDPAVVPMPPGFEELSFNLQTGDVLRREARECGNRLIIWRGGYPLELVDRAQATQFRCFYETCSDPDVCDELVYDFEKGESGYHLTLLRFGGPLVAVMDTAEGFAKVSRDRCDDYKKLARELWGQPQREALDGRMEIYEINDRVWGAVLCVDLTGGELFVGKAPRIEEMTR